MQVAEDTPLWTTDEPVALVVEDHSPRRTLGWRLGASTLDVAAELTGTSPRGESPVLCPGGHVLLIDRIEARATREGGCVRDDPGLARVDLRTGKTSWLAFAGLPHSPGFAHFGGSPDGTSVSLAYPWERTPGDWSTMPPTIGTFTLGLYVARFDGTAPVELAVLEDFSTGGSNADDVSTQWSPDGTRIAFSIAWQDLEAPWHSQRATVIYDAVTGAEIHRVPGSLCGSASWSPDGTLLLLDHATDDTWIHDLTSDTCRPVTTLAPAGGRDMRPVRPLGLADADHLVTARWRGERMTIALTNLTDGSSAEILSWSYLEARYPTIAAMPHGTWAAATAGAS